ncbi:MAG: FtsK/SpoIIIE domain-containing protein [Erysipelotrichaceae bacterium]|nr:FtsK/SpoIIIE domain-containing protein [Erysipelotrichaceae bacterium]
MFLIIDDRRILQFFDVKEDHLIEGIYLKKKKDIFYLCLENGYVFSDHCKIKRLKADKYTIHHELFYNEINIYVYEDDKGINDYNFYKRKDFIISASENSHIITRDRYLKNAYLSLVDDVLSANFPVYLNKCFAHDEEKIKSGDRIDFLGIRIYVFDDFYYMNGFMMDNHLPLYDTDPKIIKYHHKKEKAVYNISGHVKRYELKPLKKYEKPKIQKKEINSIFPNLIMVISLSCIAGISFYNSYLHDQPLLNRISFVVMPVAMMISGIFIPLISYLLNERKNRKIINRSIEDYLSYLDEYEKESLSKIEEYLNRCNSYYFSLRDTSGKLFSCQKKDDYFMHISLGKMKTSFPLEYENTNEEKIDRRLDEIKRRFMDIDGYPLMFDLMKYRRMSLVSIKEEKDFFFNKILLELSYKHHYDDVLIALYSKDSRIYNSFYNLPHLFYKGMRLTFNSEKQLKLLNSIEEEKPVILMMYDYLDIKGLNDNIHCLYFSDDIRNLLKDNEALIEYRNSKAYLFENEKREFHYEIERINFEEYYTYLGKIKTFKGSENISSFNQYFDIRKIDDYYHHHDKRLKAIFALGSEEVLKLDLHEKGYGPHGLIGGSTGSGKSELIVSLLLSLCIKYPPDYLNIVLIDYKGGGIKESLSYKGQSVLHIIACVSNLEHNALERLIIALNLECKKRQSSFNEMSHILNTSIMNLDDYLDNLNRCKDSEKMAHLLIVVDEFAELKKLHPEEIKELISISRIGRSLGIHLILATQKPAGVIDEEIWSNSRFKIALKMFDEKDSNDVLKVPDAAYLSEPGSFLLRVDDEINRYRSIYARNDMSDYDPYRVSLFDNLLRKEKETKKEISGSKTQCEAYCEKINEISSAKGYHLKDFDFLSPLPMERKKLCSQKCFVIGESDDYLNNKKGLVAYGLKENILICSSRKKEINSFLNTLNEYKRKTIVISNRYYQNEMISDSILYHETEDIIYLFKILLKEDLDICLLIEDVFSFLSYSEDYLNLLINLLKQNEGKKMNILCFTNNSSISYRLINCFKKRILIEISELSSIVDFYSMKSMYKGRSFYYKNEPITFVPVVTEEFMYGEREQRNIVRHIPKKIKPMIIENHSLIGYDLKNRSKIFVKQNLKIFSLKEDLLKPYRKYSDMDVQVYDYKTVKLEGKDILWLGPGIFEQRLFITSLRNDLSDDEGVYVHLGQPYKIRILNDE